MPNQKTKQVFFCDQHEYLNIACQTVHKMDLPIKIHSFKTHMDSFKTLFKHFSPPQYKMLDVVFIHGLSTDISVK